MLIYLDASCLVRAVMRDGPALEEWATWDGAYTSRLAIVEVSRTLHRFRLEGKLLHDGFAAAEANVALIFAGMERVPISDSIIAMAAEPMATHIKALDALHLATARMVRTGFREELTFATHDRQLGRLPLLLALR